jgi:copper chaperone
MIRFRIANMTCGGCVKGVTATLRAADPAAEPSFDLDKREVTLASHGSDLTALEKALAEAGWQAERLA